MKARIKGNTEWEEYQESYGENGMLIGLIVDRVRTKQYLAGCDNNQAITIEHPLIMPLSCFDLWEEPNLQSLKNQAAISAMQGMLANPWWMQQINKECEESRKVNKPEDFSTILSEYANLYAEALIKNLI